MLIVLHGAKKNVGDFLIRKCGLALLRHVLPQQELVPAGRWLPLDPDLLERADAVVLCGGPGLRRNFYPGTFPLADDLDSIATPVLPLALGWSGEPAGRPEAFSFDGQSRRALKQIHQRIDWSSVRDDLSLEILKREEVGEVRRSGCTAWYHLPSLGLSPRPPSRVTSVVFTPPANGSSNFADSVRILRLLGSRYPSARRYCVFHRGLRPDGYTGRRESAVAVSLAGLARALGWKVIDAAYDLSRIDFYGEVDLHVGYRVHAHLAFLSRRRPSLLIAEDGRGAGQAVTLGDPHHLRAGEPELLARLDNALASEESEGHPFLGRAVSEIEDTWPTMRETIQQLSRAGRRRNPS